MCKRLPIQFIFVAYFLFCWMYQLNAQQQDRGKKIMDSLINVLPNQRNDSTKAMNLMWLSRLKMGDAQNTGNWNEAIEWWQKTLNLSIKTKYEWGIGKSNIYLGQCWVNKGDYAEAVNYFYAALNLSFKNGNNNLRAAAYGNLAGCYTRLGNDKEALKNLLLVYEITQQLNNNVSANPQQTAAGIAKIYAKLHLYEEALNWYQKALPDDPELFYEGDITLQIASIQMEMKRYDEALKNFRVAVQLFPARFNRKPDADYKGLLGDWFRQLGEAYIKIGTLTKNSERNTAFLEAIDYLNKSLPFLKEGAGGKESLLTAYELLKQASESINDYQNALHFTILYNGLKDSIYNKTTYLKMADLQVKYETEKAAALLRIEQEKENLRTTAMLAGQKLEQEKILADERVTNETVIAEQKLEQEKAMAIAGEKANYEKSMAIEKIRNEKQQSNNLLLMGLILVVITSFFLIFYFRQSHQKKRAVEKAEAVHQMAELEMQSLRSQLNPHFMFNSLNSIQTMIMKEQTDKSQSYLSRFARLLRMLLENADKQFVPLRIEMEFLQLYLSLESLRVPDMQYSISTDSALNTEQILIPNMILQPYVENAIWHGLSHKETDKQLRIRVFRENGTINYEIEDNGVGRKKAGELKSLFRKQHQSKGMELISKRIELLNKEYSSVIQTEVADVVKNNEVAGTLVSIKVPLTFSKSMQN